jgi:hypothetical protein
MHVLFVHPNFPAQFRYIAPRLARALSRKWVGGERRVIGIRRAYRIRGTRR